MPSSQGQEKTILTYEEYINRVKTFHPQIMQLKLYDQKSDAYIKKAKGGFDPKINLGYDNKSFEDKNYWEKLEGKLKVPLWYGIDIESGYDVNNGQFINTENTLPENGLLYAGLKIPIGSGLLFNERRKVLEEAKLIGEQIELKRIEKYNEIILKASKRYVKWQIADEKQKLFNRMVAIAVERFENVKASYLEGANPAIDTLEAKIIVDNRNQEVLKNQEKLMKARLDLSIYLWDEGYVPLEVNDITYPEPFNINQWQDPVDEIIINQQSYASNNTQILRINNDQKLLENEKRLLKENLKPEFNIRVNPLLNTSDNSVSFSQNNYKLGAHFSYPILNRKVRGKLALVELERQENQLDQVNLMRNIELNLNAQINSTEFIKNRHTIAKENAKNSQSLVQAEMEKFSIGESSIFLINAREQKQIDFQEKVLDLKLELISQQLEIIGLTQKFD